jgi:hypothetical protein
MTKTKNVYWWVSVAGNHCEPAVVKERMVYTLGCSDGFDLDKLDCPVTLIEKCDPPLTPAQEQYQLRKQRKALQEQGWHGYRFDLVAR